MSGVSNPALTGRDGIVAGALFFFVFLAHALSPNATPFDSRWTVYTASSILHEGNTDLNEYEAHLEADGFYAIECIQPDKRRTFPVASREQCPLGRYFNWYPVAVPALAAPVIGALELGIGVGAPVFREAAARVSSPPLQRFLRGNLIEASPVAEVIVASLIVALTAMFFYLLARELLDRAGAAALAGVLAFCTPAWSTASRGLWQHGPAMLMLTLALWIALRSRDNPTLIRYLGVPLALGFYIRPTGAVPAVVFSLFVLLHYRRQLVGFLLGVVPVVVVFVTQSYLAYGGPLAPYFYARRENADGLGFHSRMGEALAGNLLSPSRGLLVYVPLAALAVWGMLLRPKQDQARKLRPYLAAILALHWLLISSFETWWGGHGYGPRFMTDVMPIIVFFLVPVWEKARQACRQRRYALPGLVTALVAASFWVHFQGATRWACYEWSTLPVELNQSIERLWDWRDPAFLRGVRGGPPST